MRFTNIKDEQEMTMKAEFHTRAAESLTKCFYYIFLNPYGRFKVAILCLI